MLFAILHGTVVLFLTKAIKVQSCTSVFLSDFQNMLCLCCEHDSSRSWLASWDFLKKSLQGKINASKTSTTEKGDGHCCSIYKSLESTCWATNYFWTHPWLKNHKPLMHLWATVLIQGPYFHHWRGHWTQWSDDIYTITVRSTPLSPRVTSSCVHMSLQCPPPC